MRPNLILHVIAKFVIPLIILFALYVQFHGDFGPGGGFQAGVIFSAALILYSLVFGLDAAERIIPAHWLRILAALGVLIYAGVGVLFNVYLISYVYRRVSRDSRKRTQA